MRVTILFTIAALLGSGAAAAAAGKPASYAISIKGSADLTSSNETDDRSEGGACMLHSVWKGQDTLTYASEQPVVAALTSTGGSANIRVRYQYDVSGWRDSVTTSGNCPNGAPPFGDHPPGCHTYAGVFVVHVVITHGKVAVSSVVREFGGDGLCPGTRSLGVWLSSAKINMAQLSSRGAAIVVGTGPDASVRLDPAVHLRSAFTLRLKRR